MDRETQDAAEATDPVDPLLDGQTRDEDDEDDLFGEPPGSDLDDPADDDW